VIYPGFTLKMKMDDEKGINYDREMEMDLIEFLHSQSLLDDVIRLAGGPYLVTGLRASCKRGAELVPRPERLKNKNALLHKSAHNGNIIVCQYAREHGATDWDMMLRVAACGGHAHVCRLAREWGATSRNMMMYGAARCGHEHVCRLAREWGVTDWNWMLEGAARGGYEHLCRLAREWGADDWNIMLQHARNCGHKHLCDLAIEWGATV
jgi:hypothetical protein